MAMWASTPFSAAGRGAPGSRCGPGWLERRSPYALGTDNPRLDDGPDQAPQSLVEQIRVDPQAELARPVQQMHCGLGHRAVPLDVLLAP